MAFTLRVTFAGLCLFVRHPTRRAAQVLLVNARSIPGDTVPAADPQHDDHTFGRPHVGYLRLDLANLVPDAPRGPATTAPAYEVVYRLQRQELRFEPPLTAPADDATPFPVDELHVVEFGDVAPGSTPHPGLLAGTSTTDLLFRTLVRGGTLVGNPSDKPWFVPSSLQPTDRQKRLRDTFSGSVTWKRDDVPGDSLDLVLRSLDAGAGRPDTRITLRPVDENGKMVIALKIANLCAVNPLEWPDFPKEVVYHDTDFKWMYRLLRPEKAVRFAHVILGSELPYPRLDLPAMNAEGDPGCGCGGSCAAFTLPPDAAVTTEADVPREVSAS